VVRESKWTAGAKVCETASRRTAARFSPPCARVVLIIAGKDFHTALTNLKDASGQLVNEVGVVGNEDDRASKFLQRIQQDVLSAKVEMVCGLVEQQEV